MGYQCKTGSMVRFERAKKRTECQLQPKPEMNASASEDMSVEKQADMDREDSTCDLCVQTMPYLESLEYLGVQTMPYLESEVQSLRLEISELKEKLDCYTFSEKSFQDQTRVKYYKGLPNFLMLMALFNYLSPYISSGPRIVTTKFQELLMVLMRLRLSLPVQVIADMFLVSQSTASRIFLKVIDVMYTRLNPLIIWPDRKNLQETMPREFQQYFRKKVTVIIDCFELFIETPSNLKARTQTFSSYKHHNTIKYLTGITPQGVVSYISSGWGGRTSDKCLTENCSFLDNLLPGDLVLAHWGFNIQESVGLMCAEVKIPAFTKGKKQLSAFDVESTRKIAHVRIHVERVIGNIVQKYQIVDSTIPITFLSVAEEDAVTTLDKVVTVCCALVNMCPSVVPFD